MISTPSLQLNESVVTPPVLRRPATAVVPALARQYVDEGAVHLQAGDAEAAVAALTLAVQEAPEYSDAHVFLGIAYALTYNVYPAIDHLEEATRLDEDSFAAHYTLAQLNFKLRIPQKGYEAAEYARQTAVTLEQRKLLTALLKEEKARERNGIARPLFDKPFSIPALFLAGSGLAAGLVTIIRHIR